MAPHFLLLPFPLQGHLPSMVLLARKLVNLGCNVTLANISAVHQLLLELEEFQDQEFMLEPLQFDYPMPAGVVAAYNQDPPGFLNALHQELKAPFEQLIQQQKHKISCVVADHFMGELSWPISHRLGIPFVTYWSGNASWLLFDYHVPELLAAGQIPLTEAEFVDDCRNVDVPGLGLLKPSEAPSHAYEAFLSDKTSRIPFVSGKERISRSSWILSNTFQELEPSSIEAVTKLVNPRFLPVGPLVPDDSRIATVLNTGKHQESKCLRWLDDKEPCSVLYVAFGTIAYLSSLQMQEVAKGLKASRVPFIWVLRPQEAANLPAGLFEEGTSKTMFVSWAPQKQTLVHPSVCGFLTHCGWNSVLESLLAGVPMLAWPCIYDQPINCKLLIQEWKAGLGFARDRSSGLVLAGEVERVVRAFMTCQQELRSSTLQLAARARRCVDLVSFVQSIPA